MEFYDLGNDELLVLDGERSATGWVSAVWNHHDLDDSGERVSDTPRVLTQDELEAYGARLLDERYTEPELLDLSALSPGAAPVALTLGEMPVVALDPVKRSLIRRLFRRPA